MAGTAVDSKCSVVTVSMDIYSALVLFCPCFKFYFPMYITKRLSDITIPTKQRKIKLKPGIKLNLYIYLKGFAKSYLLVLHNCSSFILYY